MQPATTTKRKKSGKPEPSQAEAFELRTGPAPEAEEQVHLLGPGKICDTEARGHATPQGRSVLEIVLDASNGFIPLWASGTVLRWRFRERSMSNFARPAAFTR